MKQYLLSVHYVEGQPPPPPDVVEQMHRDVAALNDELIAQGAWIFAGGLEEPDVASVVREENGEVLVTDGPFPEAKEHLGGFWVIKAPDLDAALAWAERATRACRGPVEVRPFQDEAEE
jgi:hypothetical protein